MVDKIDKPEAPSPYAIGATKETKRDKPREEGGQEDLPTFKREDSSLYREKFQKEPGTSKTVKVAVVHIEKLLFRRATPHHGVPTAEANLVWKDGRTTDGVNFRIQNWQDFLKIKNLKQGEIIPPPFWNYGGEELEITIVKLGTTSGSWNLRELQREDQKPKRRHKPFLNAVRGINPWMAGLCFLAFITLFLLGLFILK